MYYGHATLLVFVVVAVLGSRGCRTDVTTSRAHALFSFPKERKNMDIWYRSETSAIAQSVLPQMVILRPGCDAKDFTGDCLVFSRGWTSVNAALWNKLTISIKNDSEIWFQPEENAREESTRKFGSIGSVWVSSPQSIEWTTCDPTTFSDGGGCDIVCQLIIATCLLALLWILLFVVIICLVKNKCRSANQAPVNPAQDVSTSPGGSRNPNDGNAPDDYVYMMPKTGFPDEPRNPIQGGQMMPNPTMHQSSDNAEDQEEPVYEDAEALFRHNSAAEEEEAVYCDPEELAAHYQNRSQFSRPPASIPAYPSTSNSRY